ncbi:MAG TPA: hypothetical protein VJG13_02235 [Thermoanaerobaculia bacterium]|nr:hypothetical protein [Thermoanaerobaculia bacterium]
MNEPERKAAPVPQPKVDKDDDREDPPKQEAPIEPTPKPVDKDPGERD